MIHDILLAIPWAFLLAISIGPGFFMLLETSITKGFKAALTFDLGIVFSDLIFIYFNILIMFFKELYCLNYIFFTLNGLFTNSGIFIIF